MHGTKYYITGMIVNYCTTAWPCGTHMCTGSLKSLCSDF